MTASRPAPLDARLIRAGMAFTLTTLVTVWADHTPAHQPIPDTCRTCGHNYQADGPLCPSAATVRPLLQRRRHEPRARALLSILTVGQELDLIGPRLPTKHLTRTRRLTSTAVIRIEQPSLFTQTHPGGTR